MSAHSSAPAYLIVGPFLSIFCPAHFPLACSGLAYPFHRLIIIIIIGSSGSEASTTVFLSML